MRNRSAESDFALLAASLVLVLVVWDAFVVLLLPW